MKEKNNAELSAEELQFQIEFKKARLNLKTGMTFESNFMSDLPPEIENEFLDSVERFEEAWKNAKQILLFDKLKQPVFRKSEELEDREISAELKKVRKILMQHNISIDAVFYVDDRAMYEFITVELMQHMVDDIRIAEMITCYIYEEFHPNHEEDIREKTTSFVNELLNKTIMKYPTIHSDFIKNNEPVIKFCDAFEKFTIHHFNISQLIINKKTALVNFEIKFTGDIDRASGNVVFNGKGKAKFKSKFDYWELIKLELPV